MDLPRSHRDLVDATAADRLQFWLFGQTDDIIPYDLLQLESSYGPSLTGKSRRPPRVIPIGGWFLDSVAALDAEAPGVAGHVLRASSERRQVIAAYLSVSQPHSDFKSAAETGWFLTQASHEAILKAGFGACPDGLRGALRRAGDKPHKPRFYRYLYELLHHADRPSIAAIHQMQSITMSKLRILRTLSPILRQAALVDHLKSVEQAQDVVSLVALLERHGLDQTSMLDALARVGGPKAISRFATRWAEKLAFPPHPVPATDGYRPVQTGAELYGLALSYRNCLRTHVAAVMEERSSFAEITTPAGSAVIHLVRIGHDWVLEQVWGRDNCAPPSPVEDTAVRYLASHGVLERQHWMQRSHAWSALRRLTNVYDFGEDIDIA